MVMTEDELIDGMLNIAFAEDIGDGDHSTLCSFAASVSGRSKLLIKEKGILAGVVADGHDDMLTIAVTEKRTPAKVEYYVSLNTQML